MGGMILLILMSAMYLVPFLIAAVRGHRNVMAIGMLNLLLGWTVLGWIVAFVWAFTADVWPDAKDARHGR